MATQYAPVKWIPHTRFLVDGFRQTTPECKHYFLTHAHSDHTTGLAKSWDAGTIYCTPVTARLVTEELGIRSSLVKPLPLGTPVTIDGVTVTALDANHCPGAALLLFTIPQPGKPALNVLHTGDFRFHPGMAAYPALRGVQIDTLFLDTTYATPRWTFPDQEAAIESMVAAMRAELAADPGTVFACNAYHIGKERAYFSAAAAAGLRVWVPASRAATLRRLQLPSHWLALLVQDVSRAGVVVADRGVSPPALAQLATELRRRVVGFQCTGWSFQKSGIRRREQDGCRVYGIPYSEHSSWTDLRACVRAFRPRKLVPTVNVHDDTSLRAMAAKFADLMDLSRSRGHMDMYLRPGKQRRVSTADATAARAAATPRSAAGACARAAGERVRGESSGAAAVLQPPASALGAWKSEEREAACGRNVLQRSAVGAPLISCPAESSTPRGSASCVSAATQGLVESPVAWSADHHSLTCSSARTRVSAGQQRRSTACNASTLSDGVSPSDCPSAAACVARQHHGRNGAWQGMHGVTPDVGGAEATAGGASPRGTSAAPAEPFQYGGRQFCQLCCVAAADCCGCRWGRLLQASFAGRQVDICSLFDLSDSEEGD